MTVKKGQYRFAFALLYFENQNHIDKVGVDERTASKPILSKSSRCWIVTLCKVKLSLCLTN
jgi:hypothetical protein